jgi:hypothetical protein
MDPGCIQKKFQQKCIQYATGISYDSKGFGNKQYNLTKNRHDIIAIIFFLQKTWPNTHTERVLKCSDF